MDIFNRSIQGFNIYRPFWWKSTLGPNFAYFWSIARFLQHPHKKRLGTSHLI